MGAAILVGIIPVGRLLRRICLEELVEFVSVGTAALLVVVRKLDDYNVTLTNLRLDFALSMISISPASKNC